MSVDITPASAPAVAPLVDALAPVTSVVLDRTALKDALEVVNLTTTKEAGAVTSVILFEVRPAEGKLLLKSSNRRAFTCAPLALKSVTGTSPRAFTVDAKSLLQWLAAVDAEGVEVSDLQPDGCKFTCGKMSAYMRSLDPSTFPDQSDNLAKAQERMVSCTAEQLASGFSFVKPFLAQPGAATSVKEALQIAAWTKDQVVGSDSKIMGLYRSFNVKDAELKVAFQEVGGMVSFLRKFAAETVEVLRHNQIIFVVTASGAYYGFSEPTIQAVKFPALDPKPDNEPVVLSLPPSEVSRAIKAVSATAEPRDVYLSLELRPVAPPQPTSEPAPFLDEESAAAARAAQAELDKAQAKGPTHELVFRMRDASERHDNEAAIPVHLQRGEDSMPPVYFNQEGVTAVLGQFSADGVLLCFNTKLSYLKVYDQSSDHERCAYLTMLKPPAHRPA